jgi:hypothetical protein
MQKALKQRRQKLKVDHSHESMLDTVAWLSDGAYDLAELLLQPVAFRKAVLSRTRGSDEQLTRLCRDIFRHARAPMSTTEATTMVESFTFLHRVIRPKAAHLLPAALLAQLCKDEASNTPAMFSLYEPLYRFALNHCRPETVLKAFKLAATTLRHRPLWSMARERFVTKLGSFWLWRARLYDSEPESPGSMADAEAADVEMLEREEERDSDSVGSVEEEEKEEGEFHRISHRMDVVQHEMYAFFDRCHCNIDDEETEMHTEGAERTHVSCRPLDDEDDAGEAEYEFLPLPGPSSAEVNTVADPGTKVSTSELMVVDAPAGCGTRDRVPSQTPRPPAQTVDDIYALYCTWAVRQGLRLFAFETVRYWLEGKVQDLRQHPHVVLRLPPPGVHAWCENRDEHGMDHHIFAYERQWYAAGRLGIVGWRDGPAGPRSRLRLRRLN